MLNKEQPGQLELLLLSWPNKTPTTLTNQRFHVHTHISCLLMQHYYTMNFSKHLTVSLVFCLPSL